ncbi:MAG: Rrf2 family transcriptional regulator [Sphingobacteriales bacterium]|nr:Rrf2 family transcriptional regulator [Sphingobacteriales bacterium]
MFSKACEYAIRATIYIAEQSQEHQRVSLKDIAREIDSPEAFTAKILQQLVKTNIIYSTKGASGGFETDVLKMKVVKLSDIVLAIDGDDIYKLCVLGLNDCSEEYPCPVHHKFKHIKKDIREMLENTNILEMSNGLKEGLTCLKF